MAALAAPAAFEVLLVEDNEHDVLLTREAFARSDWSVALHHVSNGEECLAYLRRQGRFSQAARPSLILLDLNMPVMDGREALTELVADPELQELPVVILTTSSDSEDVRAMYRLRCNSYVCKPVEFDRFEQLIRELGQYWFGVVLLPTV